MFINISSDRLFFNLKAHFLVSETEPDETRQLTVLPTAKAPQISRAVAASIVASAGDQAARRFLEFFAATIRNRNPRVA